MNFFPHDTTNVSKRLSSVYPVIIILCLGLSAGTTPGAEVHLSNARPRPGDIVRVTVASPDSCRVNIHFQNRHVPVWQQAEESVAWVGIDVEAASGRRQLIVTRMPCGPHPKPHQQTVPITVRPHNFPVQRIRIPDSEKVVLSEKDLKRVRREQDQIVEVLSRIRPEKLWTLPFVPPLAAVKPGNSFGARRIINGHPRSPHKGEDYAANRGDTVYAINRGRISLNGSFFFSGRSVFIDHGLGFHSYYFHLSTILVQEGTVIQKGEPLGLAGASGRATGPHLHLGVRIQQATVDPDQLYTGS